MGEILTKSDTQIRNVLLGILSKAQSDIEALRGQGAGEVLNDARKFNDNEVPPLDDRISTLLSNLESAPSGTPVFLDINGAKMFFSLQEIYGVLMDHYFAAPHLRKELSKAQSEIEALQEQIPGEALTFTPLKWEYSFLRFSDSASDRQVDKQFDEMGEMRWELVSMESNPVIAVFKRPVCLKKDIA
jgi:hypothetical protein